MFNRFARCLALAVFFATARTCGAAETSGYRIMSVQPPAEISRDGGRNWDAASTNSDSLKPTHRLRTGEKGSVQLLHPNKATVIRIGELSSFIVPEERGPTRLRFFKGIGYFFNRDKPGQNEVEGPMVGAVVKGTEFVFAVDDAGQSRVIVLEGEVDLTNALGTVTLKNGEIGVASPNTPPGRLPALVSDMPGAIQWCLYYPGTLDPAELRLPDHERARLDAVLKAYRAGDLRSALLLFSELNGLQSPGAKMLGLALDLAGGRAEDVRVRLNEFTSGETSSQARALRWLIDGVQFRIQPNDIAVNASALSSSELLALSYAQQSRGDLPAALRSGRAAAAKSPEFGYAWARLADLEFSFGRARESVVALDNALRLSPRNAQAHALQGFLFASQNKPVKAGAAFERAIALDGGLANGWLGRGLLRIRQGDEAGGREDLLMAAAAEPQRAFLRSYLGKALDLANNVPKARHELELAEAMDPADPTPWLYSALLAQKDNRINDAVRDLHAAQDRNDNRAVYRSRFLLDQDRAIGSAHLASIYRDAGMEEQARHESATSLASDYGNPSAHLFLAESYLTLDRVNLRYEGARVSEYLIANLLTPAGAGAWSPALSQQQYSSLFDRDGAGLVSSTEYRSNGRWSQMAAAFGNWRGSSATLDGFYLTDPGFRPNNDLRISAVSFQIKQQITPEDTLYVQPLWSSAESGDLVEHYSDALANPSVRIHESQEPIFLAGWRHDWAPGHKTIILLARLDDNLRIENPNAFLARVDTPQIGNPVGRTIQFDERYRSQFEAYTAELQQIFQRRFGDTILGGRAQLGDIRAQSTLTQVGSAFPPLADRADIVEEAVDRFSAYAYQSWKPYRWFELVGGLSYDTMEYPANFRYAPLLGQTESRDQFSPKAGFAAQPWRGSTLRLAYAQSLGGVGFDQSFRIEPSQVAGINQRFRSMIPEAIAGSNAAERMEMAGADLSQQLGSNTWISISTLWLSAELSRRAGAIRGAFPDPLPFLVQEELDYRERSLQIAINRLIGNDVAIGASYALSEATFSQATPEIFPPAARAAGLATEQKSVLQQATLFGIFNHRSGVFARAEAIWTHQDNRRDVSVLKDDDFWQGNIFGGYRFARRRAELGIGLLNVTDQHYSLHPLNLHGPLTRERTLFVSLKWEL